MNLRSGTVVAKPPPKTPKQKHVVQVSSPSLPLVGKHKSYTQAAKVDAVVKKIAMPKPKKVKVTPSTLCPVGKVKVSYCRPETYKK